VNTSRKSNSDNTQLTEKVNNNRKQVGSSFLSQKSEDAVSDVRRAKSSLLASASVTSAAAAVEKSVSTFSLAGAAAAEGTEAPGIYNRKGTQAQRSLALVGTQTSREMERKRRLGIIEVYIDILHKC
jgi:hypothetical protein